MSLRIHLDGPSATYTNLDIVTGRVILNLPAQASFSSIIVKLEGESRTRLQGIRPGAYSDGQQGKPTTETEFHRVSMCLDDKILLAPHVVLTRHIVIIHDSDRLSNP